MDGHSRIDRPPSAQADLAEKFSAWVDYLSFEKHFSKHTLRAYLFDLHYFFDFMTAHNGKAPSMNDLGNTSLMDFRSWLSRRTMDGVSAATRARSLASVRNFFTWLDKNGHLHNPSAAALRTPKQPKRLPRALPEHQAKIAATEAHKAYKEDENPTWMGLRDDALFTMLYCCGLRINEALQLNYNDRPRDGEIRVMGKGRKERLVPVLPIAEKTLEKYLAACPYPFEKSTPLFLGARGERMNQGIAQRQLRILRKKLGLPETLTPHALRHSFATHILLNGADLRSIQELLGHASVSTTQRYTELDNQQLFDIYKKTHPRA